MHCIAFNMEIKSNTPLMQPDANSDRDSDIPSRTPSDHPDDPQPPDGGFWAWLVLVGCFLVNGIIFGIINTFGILFVQLKKDMDAAGVEDAATKCGNTYYIFTHQQVLSFYHCIVSSDWVADYWDNILLVIPGWNP